MVATHTRFSFQLRGYSLPRPKTKVVDSSLWSSIPTALRAQKQITGRPRRHLSYAARLKWCRECPFCTRSIWILSDPERSRQFDETLGGTPCHGIEVRRIQCNRIASVRRNISDVRRGGRVVEGTRLLIWRTG